MNNLINKIIRGSTQDPETGCWNWEGGVTYGYGHVYYTNKKYRIHRVAYEHFNTPLLDGKVIMHTCDNKKCWNPKHLVQGSQGDNVRDCLDKGRNYNQSKTHCIHGHELSSGNFYIEKVGWRRCKKCQSIREKKYYRKRVAEGYYAK